MRYEKGHKETTRQRIVETAAARFRRYGIEGVGVAEVMAEAGLTVGGFYSHFKSKEDLVRAAMEESATHAKERFNRRIEEGGLENWIRMYLRGSHRDHPEGGCTVAALASELARHPQGSRKAFTNYFQRMIEAVGEHLPDGLTPTEKRQAAVGVFASLIGAMQMSRAVTDKALSEEILEAGIATALALAHIEMPAA